MRRRLGLVALAIGLAACSSSSPATSHGRTAAPPGPTAATARPISFTATDGVRLSGHLCGTGTTAVVLSNMGDNDPALWESDMARHTLDDLRGAIAQRRAGGATRLVVAGGSLGTMATAKVAASSKAPSTPSA